MDLVKTTKDLMKFKTITGNHAEVMKLFDYVKKIYKDDNCFFNNIEHNEYNSLIVSNVKTKSFDVLMLCHVDVVNAKDKMFKPMVKGNKLYGRGSGDMKGPIAACMKTLKEVLKQKTKLKVGLVLVSDEEVGGSNGAGYLTKEYGLTSKVILDPDGGKKLNQLVMNSKGVLGVELSVKGEPCHGARPWMGEDANDTMVEVLSFLKTKFKTYSKNKVPKNKWVPTFHVGKLNGGDAFNKIAGEATAILDFRVTSEKDEQKILKTLDAAKKKWKNVSCKVFIKGDRFHCKKGKYLDLYKKLLSKEIKQEIVFENSDGASDNRYFQDPQTTVIVNQANVGNLHNDGEWLDIKSLEKFQEVQQKFVLELLKTNMLEK